MNCIHWMEGWIELYLFVYLHVLGSKKLLFLFKTAISIIMGVISIYLFDITMIRPVLYPANLKPSTKPDSSMLSFHFIPLLITDDSKVTNNIKSIFNTTTRKKEEEEEDIAIIGIGCRLPGGSRTPQQFYEQLLEGLDGVSKVTPDRWSPSFTDQGLVACERGGFLDMKEWTHFDRQFFGILTKDAAGTDPQVRLFVSVIWEALEDAHIDPAAIRGSDTSVFLGQMFEANSHMHSHDITSMVGNRGGRSDTALKASYLYDFRGQSLSIDTACSSSLIGVLQGIDTIRRGESDISVCGGMNAFLDPATSIMFTGAGMLGKTGKCASFDASADGYVRGEGVGVVVLKRLSKAIADNDNIYCVIKGGCSNTDGNFEKTSPTAPSPAAQQLNTKRALAKVGFKPEDIYYIECHGTGTPTGDPLEIQGIARVFGESHTKSAPLRIGSVKSNIGHTESTAGVASIIKCAMMLKNRTLIKNINFNQLNPRIDLLDGRIKIVLENEPFPPNQLIKIGINSFGLTGSNSHIILQEYQNNNNIKPEIQINNQINNNDYLIPFSANSKKSIELYIDMIKNNVDSYRNKMTFEDFVRYQSQSKTNHPTCKKVIIAKDWDSFSSSSTMVYEKQQTFVSSMSQLNNGTKKSIVMVFCGQGAQWSGMGEKLYTHYNVFRDAVDHVDQLLSQHYQYSIISKLRNSNEKEIHHPILAQPSTFIIQVALVKLYQYFGIIPSIVVGHSFGDITAAWCSGIISLKEACRIVYIRSVAQNNTIASGRMLAVSLSYDQFKERFQSSSMYDSVELACYNSADSIVLAGDQDQLLLIDQQLKNENVFSAFLGTPCAFHSSKQESTKEFIFNHLDQIKYECDKPTIQYYSTTTSKLIESSSEFNAQYIYDNLRQPVLFQQTINNINLKFNNNNQKEEEYIYLEIAPHSTLSFYLKTLLQKSTTILSPLNRKKDEIESIQSCLSQLYFIGANVDFSCQLPPIHILDTMWKDRTRHLPRYQWDSEYLWHEQESFKTVRLQGVSTTLLGACHDGSLVFESSIDVNRPSYQYLKGHKVKGKYLFPGAGYIENIINAFPNKDIFIHNLGFIAPFFLKEGVVSRLKSSFIPSSSSLTDYQVVFKYYDDKVSKWIKSSVGRLTIKNPTTILEKYDHVDQLKQDVFNVAVMTPSDVYEKLNKVGLMYGETFRRVVKISFSEDGAILCEVDAKARNHFEQSNTVLNASVLDCILHSNIVKFKGEHPKCEVVFDRVEDFHIYSNNLPKHPCNSLFNMTNMATATNRHHQYLQRGNEFKGSLDIIDQHGNIIVKCGTVVCTSLTKVLNVHQAKHPSKDIIKQSIFQPKNSPLLPLNIDSNSSSNNNIFEYLERFIKYASTTHKMIRIIDFGSNELMSLDFIRAINHSMVTWCQDLSVYFVFPEPTLVLSLESMNLSKKMSIKLIQDFDPSKSLIDQGLLTNSFDLIISTLEFTKNNNNSPKELYQLLNPNGQLVLFNNNNDINNDYTTAPDESNRESTIINHLNQFNIDNYLNDSTLDNVGMICRKPSIEEIGIGEYDHLLFITPSLSSSLSSSLSDRIIKQSTLPLEMVSNSVGVFSSDDIMNESKYQSLLDAITLNNNNNSSGRSGKVVIIYLESTEEMKANNLELKSIQLVRLYQIIGKEQLSVKLITLISGQLNQCLVPIRREYDRLYGTHQIDSVTICVDDASRNQISLAQILKFSNNHYTGEEEFKLKCDETTGGKIQVLVERLVHGSDQLQLDPRYIVNDHQDINVAFEKDSKYHLGRRNQTLLDNQVEIQVKAASINFKDIVILNGMVSQNLFPSGDVYNPPLGQDLSGIVTRIGSQVTKFKVGDQVYGLSNSSTFSYYSIAFQHELFLKPNQLSFTQAASIPLSLGTSYYALFKKANIDSDETILIHSATGGVGLGILNLLKHKQHKGNIFVTVGSDEKKEYLKQNYGGDLITCILSYDNFTQRIQDLTCGRGVNFVINTLDSSRMQDNFKCLSKNGTLVDLSIDQFNNVDNIAMESLKYEKGYLAIHFGRDYAHSIIPKLQDLLVSEELQLPPVTSFSCQQINQALEHVRSRKHIGKVVLDFQNVKQDVLDPMLLEQKKPIERLDYHLDGVQDTLLITGQTGIAVESLYYIIKHSPKLRDIIVVSFSSPKYEIQLLMNHFNKSNNNNNNTQPNIHYIKCDVGDYSQLKSLILDLYKRIQTIKPVKTVIHCANIYQTVRAEDINIESHHQAMSGKATGAFNLHNLFEELDWKLNHFHLLSSFAQYIPTNGLSYSIGNAFLDGLARYRRERGLEATSIAWGSIGQAGKVATEKVVDLTLNSFGFTMIPLSYMYGVLRSSFINQSTPFTNLLCVDIVTKKLVTNQPNLRHINCHFLDIGANIKNDSTLSNTDSIEIKILDYVSEILSIEKNLLSGDTKLKDYGVDSMVSIQIKSWIETEFKSCSLNQSQIAHGTINSIIETIKRNN
ncbi:putative polyketide synthase [Cavenderia fasciculata]|uniref:Polyketide synthase n=1 Tax=Cavenderia fasciculata TaxID=261658 RepID=F4Q2B0_CACFS|nr:putative polyketide synthase [Cavenderia fasciculata]EGG18130.1 putative polyketide synthase [Cavenderia fasciculata]|eukprot:XP_004366171.1 putative polyketide synthase [Cavenderia fasciculata]